MDIFAAFVLHSAAPMLFRGRPCSEEVVECCITIEGSRCCDMHITADLLYGASSAHITLHLNLAVRQGASIGLASENLPSSPMHSTLARRGVAMQGARCFAAQAWQRRAGTAFLKGLAAPERGVLPWEHWNHRDINKRLCQMQTLAPWLLVFGPVTAIISITVVLGTAFVLVTAAPLLLGVRPTLKPVREASITVVDFPGGTAHTRHVNMMDVEASVPCARASPLLMVATPFLLHFRPAEVPVGVTGMAVVVVTMVRGGRQLHHDRLRRYRYRYWLAHYLDVSRCWNMYNLGNLDISGSDNYRSRDSDGLNFGNLRHWVRYLLVCDLGLGCLWWQVVGHLDFFHLDNSVVHIVVHDLRAAA